MASRQTIIPTYMLEHQDKDASNGGDGVNDAARNRQQTHEAALSYCTRAAARCSNRLVYPSYLFGGSFELKRSQRNPAVLIGV